MSYKFSKSSTEKLSMVDSKIKEVMQMAIYITPIDFGISEGIRTIERQKELFNAKPQLTRTMNSKHITGKAVDIFIADKTLAYDINHLCFVAGVILTCAHILNVDMRWGGNWDMDSEIIVDQNFDDLPHFELI